MTTTMSSMKKKRCFYCNSHKHTITNCKLDEMLFDNMLSNIEYRQQFYKSYLDYIIAVKKQLSLLTKLKLLRLSCILLNKYRLPYIDDKYLNNPETFDEGQWRVNHYSSSTFILHENIYKKNKCELILYIERIMDWNNMVQGRLKVIKRKKEAIQSDCNGCPVCYNSLGDVGTTTLHCGHKLCTSCFYKIITRTQHHCCPLCRKAI